MVQTIVDVKVRNRYTYLSLHIKIPFALIQKIIKKWKFIYAILREIFQREKILYHNNFLKN